MMTSERFEACRRIAAVLRSQLDPPINHGQSLLDHFQHEGTPIPEQIIPGSNPTKHLIHDPNLSGIGGDETAALRQDTDHRRLTEEGRFTTLVWTCDEVKMGGGVHCCAVWSERAGRSKESGFDGGMASVRDIQVGSVM